MKRDPNLFEAFKDASLTPKPPSAPVESRPVGTGRTPLMVQPRWLALAGLLMVVVFAAGYFMRDGRREVAAKEGPLDPAVPTATWQPSGPFVKEQGDSVGASGQTAEVNPAPKSIDSTRSGLYKPENLFTVLAITYKDVPSLQGRAKSISEFLRQQGLPAFEPVARNDRIEVLVGAAGTQGALQSVLSKLRGTRGPSGRNFDFQSAFVVNIDDHLDR